jgi:hypothetical protein
LQKVRTHILFTGKNIILKNNNGKKKKKTPIIYISFITLFTPLYSFISCTFHYNKTSNKKISEFLQKKISECLPTSLECAANGPIEIELGPLVSCDIWAKSLKS